MKFEISTIEELQGVVEDIMPHLKHNILLLKGNLGAGKTTFTKCLLKSLGSTDEVSSPTYAIVNEYDSPKGKIYHFDLYRMNSVSEVYDIGMDEYLDDSFLCIIEWPEIYQAELAGIPFHELSFSTEGETRMINFS